MTWLHFREPVSAWTHFAWLVLSLPATLVLLWLARGCWLKRAGLTVFGLTWATCFGASWLYHAVPKAIEGPFHVADHVAIYLFIAGTVTPIALVVLHGRYRASLLVAIWIMAATGVIMRLTVEPDVSRATLFYLAMGWLGMLTYFELARKLSHAKMWAMWAGGGFYTVGAVINTLHWPAFAPGVFGSHELFHLFVMAGTAFHFWFMLTVATFPTSRPLASPEPAEAERMPAGVLAAEAAGSRRYVADGV
jgi:hemolysin III